MMTFTFGKYTIYSIIVIVILTLVFWRQSPRMRMNLFSSETKSVLLSEDAKKLVDFPLVGSSTNVFIYESVGGLQSLDRYVRLKVSKTDVGKQVVNIIDNNNRKFHRTLSYIQTNLASAKIVIPPDEINTLTWWTPANITNGYYVGEEASYAVQIWVDEDNDILFVHQSD